MPIIVRIDGKNFKHNQSLTDQRIRCQRYEVRFHLQGYKYRVHPRHPLSCLHQTLPSRQKECEALPHQRKRLPPV